MIDGNFERADFVCAAVCVRSSIFSLDYVYVVVLFFGSPLVHVISEFFVGRCHSILPLVVLVSSDTYAESCFYGA